MCYRLMRPLLFLLPAERAHHLALRALKLAHTCKLLRPTQSGDPVHCLGLTFPNLLGLAAGLDKNGDYIDALAALGFGFIEVGTVTPKPQQGNPSPRLFRLPLASALINRMGFNNKGVDYLVARLKKKCTAVPVGVNIGKNATTPLDKAVDDYRLCLQKVYPYADYITINVSSPNTAGLRALQHGAWLSNLLSELKDTQAKCRAQHNKHVPLLVKLAPDLSDQEIDDIAIILNALNIEGVIATNTTINHESVRTLPYSDEQGGLSGAPLAEQARHVLQQLSARLHPDILIIAVGGISTAEDMRARCALPGVALVQIYTGLIYNGPALIRRLLRS